MSLTKPQAIRKSIHDLEEESYTLVIRARDAALAGLKNDAKSLIITVGIINVLAVIIFKIPGLLVCVAADSLIFTILPTMDFIVRFIHENKDTLSNRNSIKNRKEELLHELDSYYKELNNEHKIITSYDNEYQEEMTKVNIMDNINYVKQGISKPIEMLLKLTNNRK